METFFSDFDDDDGGGETESPELSSSLRVYRTHSLYLPLAPLLRALQIFILPPTQLCLQTRIFFLFRHDIDNLHAINDYISVMKKSGRNRENLLIGSNGIFQQFYHRDHISLE